MSDPRRILLEKLEKIEALHARTDSSGERVAAGHALDRLRSRLRELERSDPVEEVQFGLHDPYTRALFVALLRRYGLRPYRYPRQRRQTVVARVPRRFLDETLWPEFEALADTLSSFLGDITRQVIEEQVWEDASEVPSAPPVGRIG